MVLALPIALPASAQTGTGSVSVQATNNAAITLSVSDGTADFGTNLDPLGSTSNSDDIGGVVSFQGPDGSYYLWSSEGNGVMITVRSNKSWTGTIVASPNIGTSPSMSIESGVLRYSASAPGSYFDVALAPSLTTSGISFEAAGTKGVNTYTHFYALRVDWRDDPGTFVSSVTYTATH